MFAILLLASAPVTLYAVYRLLSPYLQLLKSLNCPLSLYAVYRLLLPLFPKQENPLIVNNLDVLAEALSGKAGSVTFHGIFQELARFEVPLGSGSVPTAQHPVVE